MESHATRPAADEPERPGTSDAAAALAAARDDERRMAEVVTRGARRYLPWYGGLVVVLVGATGLFGAGQGLAAYLAIIAFSLGMIVLVTTVWPQAGVRPVLVGRLRVTTPLAVGAVLATGTAVAWLSTARWGLPWLAAVTAVASGAACAALLWRAWCHGER